MTKKIEKWLKEETSIPEEVLKKLIQNRRDILKQNAKEKKTNYNKFFKNKITISFLLAATLLIMIFSNTEINATLKTFFGITTDSGVETVEKNNISTEINLKSTYNNREITLTKFVSTGNKYAFDYQFKIDDPRLKELLEKEINANEDSQHINFGIFLEGFEEENENLNQGIVSKSNFHVEGDTFYGSVIATSPHEIIPNNSNLSLHIYNLSWQDYDEYEQKKIATINDKNASTFMVDNALQYEGDWSFNIKSIPLIETSATKISDIKNLEKIDAKNDALQTTVNFYYQPNSKIVPVVSLYKNGIKVDNQIDLQQYNPETGEFKLIFGLSSLDKKSIYTVQLNNIDDSSGEVIAEVGHFDIQNE